MIARPAITIALLALSAAAQAQEWTDQVTDTVPPELTRTLIGSWYELNPDGTPHKSLFSPGIKGCARAADGTIGGEFGGDLSLRYGNTGFEAATLGTGYRTVRLEPFAEPGLRGVKLGDMTILALTPAPDGSPRIYIVGGKSWDRAALQKCPAAG